MSRVIKHFDMTLTEPMIINTREKEELHLDGEEDREDEASVQSDVEQVMAEAEEMVRELLDQARQEARNILNDSREEAEVLIQQARQEENAIHEQARREGYDEGLKKAQVEIENDRQMAMEQCQEIIQEARLTKIKIMESNTADMARLAMVIAKKIVAGELLVNPHVISNVIREAIGYLDQPGNIYVYVNPQEMEQVLADISKDSLREVGSREYKSELVADSRISPGGCMIESDAGTVDAQVETRIAKVEKAIQEVIADESS